MSDELRKYAWRAYADDRLTQRQTGRQTQTERQTHGQQTSREAAGCSRARAVVAQLALPSLITTIRR